VEHFRWWTAVSHPASITRNLTSNLRRYNTCPEDVIRARSGCRSADGLPEGHRGTGVQGPYTHSIHTSVSGSVGRSVGGGPSNNDSDTRPPRSGKMNDQLYEFRQGGGTNVVTTYGDEGGQVDRPEKQRRRWEQQLRNGWCYRTHIARQPNGIRTQAWRRARQLQSSYGRRSSRPFAKYTLFNAPVRVKSLTNISAINELWMCIYIYIYIYILCILWLQVEERHTFRPQHVVHPHAAIRSLFSEFRNSDVIINSRFYRKHWS